MAERRARDFRTVGPGAAARRFTVCRVEVFASVVGDVRISGVVGSRPFGDVSDHVVQPPGVRGVLGDVIDRKPFVGEAVVAEREDAVFRIIAAQVDRRAAFPRCVKFAALGSGEVRELREIGVERSEVEFRSAPGAGGPFPLRFGRKRGFDAFFLVQSTDEFLRFVPGDAGDRLVRVVGDVTRDDVVFSVFFDVTGVVFRIVSAVLRVRDFRFAHPERFRNFDDGTRVFVGETVERAHNEFSGWNADEFDRDAVGELDRFGRRGAV